MIRAMQTMAMTVEAGFIDVQRLSKKYGCAGGTYFLHTHLQREIKQMEAKLHWGKGRREEFRDYPFRYL